MDGMNNGDNNMRTYTATFADGETITRNSKREYRFAWKQTWTINSEDHVDYGFSKTAPKSSPSWEYKFATNERERRNFLRGEKLKTALRMIAQVKKTAKLEIVKVGA